MKTSSRMIGIFLAGLLIVSTMGCENNSDLESRLIAAEGELSNVRIELNNTQSTLDSTQAALEECNNKPPTLIGPGSLRITNNHPSLSILEVYISPTSSDTWGTNLTEEFGFILGGWNHSRLFILDPGTYDVKIVFDNGQEFEEVITIRTDQEEVLSYR